MKCALPYFGELFRQTHLFERNATEKRSLFKAVHNITVYFVRNIDLGGVSGVFFYNALAARNADLHIVIFKCFALEMLFCRF